MNQNLLAALVRAAGERRSAGGARNYAVCQRAGQIDSPMPRIQPIAEIVDDYGNVCARTCAGVGGVGSMRSATSWRWT